MATEAIKKIYKGVVSYLQYWKGNPVDTYKVMQPEADFYSVNIPSSVDGTVYGNWNTFRYCSKVKIIKVVTKASTYGSMYIYVEDEQGNTLANLGTTASVGSQSVIVDAQKLRIMYYNGGINTAYGQTGTITFEPIK